MKCRWSHCKHGGEVSKEDAVRVGNAYYHKDCYEEKKNIDSIIEFYKSNIDSDPVMPALRKVINDLVFNKGYDSGYVLYAVKYCVSSGWRLKYPAGLYYVVKDEKAKTAWSKKAMVGIKRQIIAQEQAAMSQEPPEFDLDFDNTATYKHTNNGNRFSRILGA